MKFKPNPTEIHLGIQGEVTFDAMNQRFSEGTDR